MVQLKGPFAQLFIGNFPLPWSARSRKLSEASGSVYASAMFPLGIYGVEQTHVDTPSMCLLATPFTRFVANHQAIIAYAKRLFFRRNVFRALCLPLNERDITHIHRV